MPDYSYHRKHTRDPTIFPDRDHEKVPDVLRQPGPAIKKSIYEKTFLYFPPEKIFARSGKTRRLRPQTYLLVEENGNLFINTGYRIDVSYNEETDILTFSPNGDYVRKEERP